MKHGPNSSVKEECCDRLLETNQKTTVYITVFCSWEKGRNRTLSNRIYSRSTGNNRQARENNHAICRLVEKVARNSSSNHVGNQNQHVCKTTKMPSLIFISTSVAEDSSGTVLLSTDAADSASRASFQSSASLTEAHLSFTDFPFTPLKYSQ